MPRDPRKDLSAIDPQKPATARFWTSPNGCSTRRLIGGPRMTKRLVALAALLAAGEEPFQAAKALGYRRKAARYLCGSEQFEQAYRQAGGAGDLTKLAYEHLVPSAHRRSAAQEPARLDRAASGSLIQPEGRQRPSKPRRAPADSNTARAAPAV